MKRNILLLSICLLTLTSCKKEEFFELTYQEYLYNDGTLSLEEYINTSSSSFESYKKYHPEYIDKERVWRKEYPKQVKKEIDMSKIKNLIYVIGDGMGPSAIKVAEYYSGKTFEFAKWPRLSINTNSLDDNNNPSLVTDSAAGGTALATGRLTYNGYVGCNNDENYTTILDVFHSNNKSTGIVTTDTLCGATPSDFSAHAISRSQTYTIIDSQATSNVDLLIGSYYSVYDNESITFTNNGYTYSTELNNDLLNANKLIINNDGLYPFGDSYSLKDSVKFAINYLDQNKNGFSLMIEQAHIDKYSHSNDIDGCILSMCELNNTMNYLINYFKDRDDTLIILTADHETGGLLVSPFNEYTNSSKGEKIFTYEYTSTNHTDTYVPLFMNMAINDLDSYANEDGIKIIKNNEIAIELFKIFE